MPTSEQKRFFDESGYLVLEGVFQGELLEQVREAAKALAASEPSTVMRRVWHERVLFRRKAFRRVLDVSTLIEAGCS